MDKNEAGVGNNQIDGASSDSWFKDSRLSCEAAKSFAGVKLVKKKFHEKAALLVTSR